MIYQNHYHSPTSAGTSRAAIARSLVRFPEAGGSGAGAAGTRAGAGAGAGIGSLFEL